MIYQSIRRDVPEDLNIHRHGYDTLKSHNEPHTHIGGAHFLARPVLTECALYYIHTFLFAATLSVCTEDRK